MIFLGVSEANNGSTLAEIVMSSVDNTETVEDTACEAVIKSNEVTLADIVLPCFANSQPSNSASQGGSDMDEVNFNG